MHAFYFIMRNLLSLWWLDLIIVTRIMTRSTYYNDNLHNYNISTHVYHSLLRQWRSQIRQMYEFPQYRTFLRADYQFITHRVVRLLNKLYDESSLYMKKALSVIIETIILLTVPTSTDSIEQQCIENVLHAFPLKISSFWNIFPIMPRI